MLLRKSKTFTEKNNIFNVTYGTVNINNPKAFFFEYKFKAICINNLDNRILNINRDIWKKLNYTISDLIKSKYSNQFYEKYVIVNFNLKSNSLKLLHPTSLEIEITVKPLNKNFKPREIKPLLDDLNSNFKEIIKNNLIYFKIEENEL